MINSLRTTSCAPQITSNPMHPQKVGYGLEIEINEFPWSSLLFIGVKLKVISWNPEYSAKTLADSSAIPRPANQIFSWIIPKEIANHSTHTGTGQGFSPDGLPTLKWNEDSGHRNSKIFSEWMTWISVSSWNVIFLFDKPIAATGMQSLELFACIVSCIRWETFRGLWWSW